LLHIGAEAARSFNLVYYMRKNAIYSPGVAEVVITFKEAGIFDKILHDVIGN